MVIFNELRITEDKTCLIVDCSVRSLEGYNGMYINSIDIDYYKNVEQYGVPSGKAMRIYEKGEFDAGERAVRVTLKSTELDKDTFGTDTFDAGLFFVTVTCDGTPENPEILESYSCGMDNTVDVGVVLDWEAVYRLGIGYAARLADGCEPDCDVPSGFENMVLFWHALRLAIAVCDWVSVSRLWDRFMRSFRGMGMSTLPAGCGCNR